MTPRFFTTALITFILIFNAPALAATRPAIFAGTVARVIDGDTIVIGKTRIRLFGIDAPESNRPGGAQAAKALHSRASGKHAVCVRVHTDVFGRAVCICRVNGVDLSDSQLKANQAREWTEFSNGFYSIR